MKQVLEHVFVVIFAAELMYRIYKVRWEYVRHWDDGNFGSSGAAGIIFEVPVDIPRLGMI